MKPCNLTQRTFTELNRGAAKNISLLALNSNAQIRKGFNRYEQRHRRMAIRGSNTPELSDVDVFEDSSTDPSLAISKPTHRARRSHTIGRPARRSNPLGHSGLLSSYNAKALRQGLEVFDLSPSQLAHRIGYTFSHKEVAALALLNPQVTSCGLTYSHLALLGEELLRYAAVELTWAVVSAQGSHGLGMTSVSHTAASAAATTTLGSGGAAPTTAMASGGNIDDEVAYEAHSEATARAAAARFAAYNAVATAVETALRPFRFSKPAKDNAVAAAALAAADALATAAAEPLHPLDTLSAFPPTQSGSARSGPLALTAPLLNYAAAEAVTSAAVQLMADRWQLEAHMSGFPSATGSITLQGKATCVKALIAAVFLDGGYAAAVRPVLAPLLAEVFREGTAGSGGGGGGGEGSSGGGKKPASDQEHLADVGRRLKVLLARGGLPRPVDDLHLAPPHSADRRGGPATPATHDTAMPRGPGNELRGDGEVVDQEAAADDEDGETVEELVARLHGPPPYSRTAPAAHLWALLVGLRVHGEGYQPRDVESFLVWSDIWYSNLTTGSSKCVPVDLRGNPVPRGAARQQFIADTALRARPLFVLGRAVYRVVATELALERHLNSAAATGSEGGSGADDGFSSDPMALADDKRRRAAVEQVRQNRERELYSDQARQAQMRAGFGLVPAGAGPASGGTGRSSLGAEPAVDGEGWGERTEDDKEVESEEYDGWGPVVVPILPQNLPRCADGVVAVVALEGGLRHARALVRGLVPAGEVDEVLRMAKGASSTAGKA